MKRTITFTFVVVVMWTSLAHAQPPSTALPDPTQQKSLAEPIPAKATPPMNGDSSPNSDSTKTASAAKKADDVKAAANSATEPLNITPNVQLRGRVEAEAIAAMQSQMSRDTIGELQDGFGFRRVRLGAQGRVGDSASWVSEVELAGGNVRLRDVFIGFDAVPEVRQIRIGNFREPYSLEGMTSSNFMTFLERSPLNVIAPARNWGVCGYWWPDDERVLFSVGAFRDGTGSDGQSIGNGDNWAYTTRLTGLPLYEPDGEEYRLIHLGGAFSQRTPPNGILSFTPRTGSNLLTVEDNPGSPFLPDLAIPASSYQLYNLQAAGIFGPFSLQAEWLATAVQPTDAGTIYVHGCYVQSSYFLTGEHRGYNRTRGSFDQVDVLRPVIRDRADPRGGFGAVELTTRFSYFDFNSPNLPPTQDGKPAATVLYEFTVGTNWYLNNYTRVMLNYTAGFPDKIDASSTVAHIIGLRAALYW